MVNVDRVMFFPDHEFNFPLEKFITIPCLWMYWHYLLDNLIVRNEEDAPGKMTDTIVYQLCAEFKISKMRKVIPLRKYPALLFNDIKGRKRWQSMMGSNSLESFVLMTLDKKEMITITSAFGYYLNDGDVISQFDIEQEEFLNRQVLEFYYNKIPVDLYSLSPYWDKH